MTSVRHSIVRRVLTIHMMALLALSVSDEAERLRKLVLHHSGADGSGADGSAILSGFADDGTLHQVRLGAAEHEDLALAEPIVFLGPGEVDHALCAWGIIKDAIYLTPAPADRFVNGQVPVQSSPVEQRRLEQAWRAADRADSPEAAALSTSIDRYLQRHSRVLDPLTQHLHRWKQSQPRDGVQPFFPEAWAAPLGIDVVYTAPNDVYLFIAQGPELVVAASRRTDVAHRPDRRGNLQHDGRGGGSIHIEPDWVVQTHRTTLEVPFRVVRAQMRLYVIDARGGVYTVSPEGHQGIGRIHGWGQGRQGDHLVVLEDQRAGQESIGVLRWAADGSVTRLPYVGRDETAHEDFMMEIDDVALLQALRMLRHAIHDAEQDDVP